MTGVGVDALSRDGDCRCVSKLADTATALPVSGKERIDEKLLCRVQGALWYVFFFFGPWRGWGVVFFINLMSAHCGGGAWIVRVVSGRGMSDRV